MSEANKIESEQKKAPLVFRHPDGTIISFAVPKETGDWERDPLTGNRKPIMKDATIFTPQFEGKPTLGEKFITPWGEYEITKPLSKDDLNRWPEDIFVKKLP